MCSQRKRGVCQAHYLLYTATSDGLVFIQLQKGIISEPQRIFNARVQNYRCKTIIACIDSKTQKHPILVLPSHPRPKHTRLCLHSIRLRTMSPMVHMHLWIYQKHTQRIYNSHGEFEKWVQPADDLSHARLYLYEVWDVAGVWTTQQFTAI